MAQHRRAERPGAAGDHQRAVGEDPVAQPADPPACGASRPRESASRVSAVRRGSRSRGRGRTRRVRGQPGVERQQRLREGRRRRGGSHPLAPRGRARGGGHRFAQVVDRVGQGFRIAHRDRRGRIRRPVGDLRRTAVPTVGTPATAASSAAIGTPSRREVTSMRSGLFDRLTDLFARAVAVEGYAVRQSEFVRAPLDRAVERVAAELVEVEGDAARTRAVSARSSVSGSLTRLRSATAPAEAASRVVRSRGGAGGQRSRATPNRTTLARTPSAVASACMVLARHDDAGSRAQRQLHAHPAGAGQSLRRSRSRAAAQEVAAREGEHQRRAGKRAERGAHHAGNRSPSTRARRRRAPCRARRASRRACGRGTGRRPALRTSAPSSGQLPGAVPGAARRRALRQPPQAVRSSTEVRGSLCSARCGRHRPGRSARASSGRVSEPFAQQCYRCIGAVVQGQRPAAFLGQRGDRALDLRRRRRTKPGSFGEAAQQVIAGATPREPMTPRPMRTSTALSAYGTAGWNGCRLVASTAPARANAPGGASPGNRWIAPASPAHAQPRRRAGRQVVSSDSGEVPPAGRRCASEVSPAPLGPASSTAVSPIITAAAWTGARSVRAGRTAAASRRSRRASPGCSRKRATRRIRPCGSRRRRGRARLRPRASGMNL